MSNTTKKTPLPGDRGPQGQEGSGPTEPPIGGCKVKIKDGNGNWRYITYGSSAFGTSDKSDDGYCFTRNTNRVNGREQFGVGGGYSMASDGTNVVPSNASTRDYPVPEWTCEDQKMHIHDFTPKQCITVDNDGNLLISATGSEVEFDV